MFGNVPSLAEVDEKIAEKQKELAELRKLRRIVAQVAVVNGSDAEENPE